MDLGQTPALVTRKTEKYGGYRVNQKLESNVAQYGS